MDRRTRHVSEIVVFRVPYAIFRNASVFTRCPSEKKRGVRVYFGRAQFLTSIKPHGTSIKAFYRKTTPLGGHSPDHVSRLSCTLERAPESVGRFHSVQITFRSFVFVDVSRFRANVGLFDFICSVCRHGRSPPRKSATSFIIEFP